MSLACVSTAFCISFLLPPVKTSIYFHKKSEQGEGDALEQNRGFGHRFISVVRILFQEGKQAYSQLYVVKWAFWVAISTCVNFQVGNYIQTLWEEIKHTVKEGAPEAPTCGILYTHSIPILSHKIDPSENFFSWLCTIQATLVPELFAGLRLIILPIGMLSQTCGNPIVKA